VALLSTFSTNDVDILAGINGSEVSQAVIIPAIIDHLLGYGVRYVFSPR